MHALFVWCSSKMGICMSLSSLLATCAYPSHYCVSLVVSAFPPLVVRSRDKFAPRLSISIALLRTACAITHLDFWWVGALDVRQWVLVELFLKSLREQNSELSIVDQLPVSLLSSSLYRRTHRNTKVDSCSTRSIVRVVGCWRSGSGNVDDGRDLVLLENLSELSLVFDRDMNSLDRQMLLSVNVALNLGGYKSACSKKTNGSTHSACKA